MKLLALLLLTTQHLTADLNGDPLPDVVLLAFKADYCPPCQQMVPRLQNMEAADYPIRKINSSDNPKLSRDFNVSVLPTLIVMVEGQEVQRFVGLTSESELRRAMNQAARDLYARRKARTPAPQPEAVVSESADAATEEKKRGGLLGLFSKFQSSGPAPTAASSGPAQVEDADVRAQSPDQALTEALKDSPPQKATVRVRLRDGKSQDVGTGTVIHSTAGQTLILTCAHIFMDATDNAAVEVDVFRNSQTLKYPATILGGDFEADVALLSIKTVQPLATVPVAFDRSEIQKQEELFSIGCSNGDLPTRLKMNVVDVNRFMGPATILCTNAPTQGRSGGGLYDLQNRLVGICSAADYKKGEGLYCGLPPLKNLIVRLGLQDQFAGIATSSENSGPAITDRTVRESQDVAATTPDPVTTNPAKAASELSFEDVFGSAGPLPNSQARADRPKETAIAQTAMTQQTSSLPDPFRQKSATGSTSGTEITVIIKDAKAPNGERIIVIPEASPWLLQLLTGEPQPQPAGSTAQQTVSATPFDPTFPFPE